MVIMLRYDMVVRAKVSIQKSQVNMKDGRSYSLLSATLILLCLAIQALIPSALQITTRKYLPVQMVEEHGPLTEV